MAEDSDDSWSYASEEEDPKEKPVPVDMATLQKLLRVARASSAITGEDQGREVLMEQGPEMLQRFASRIRELEQQNDTLRRQVETFGATTATSISTPRSRRTSQRDVKEGNGTPRSRRMSKRDDKEKTNFSMCDDEREDSEDNTEPVGPSTSIFARFETNWEDVNVDASHPRTPREGADISGEGQRAPHFGSEADAQIADAGAILPSLLRCLGKCPERALVISHAERFEREITHLRSIIHAYEEICVGPTEKTSAAHQ